MTVSLQQPLHVRNEGSGSEGQRGSSPAWPSDPVSVSQLLASTSITGKGAFSLMFQSYAISYVTIEKRLYAFGKLLPDPYYCYCARDSVWFPTRRKSFKWNQHVQPGRISPNGARMWKSLLRTTPHSKEYSWDRAPFPVTGASFNWFDYIYSSTAAPGRFY